MSFLKLTPPLFLGANLVESFIDNVIRDKVSPAIGSVVYCEMAFGLAEHSGIYVGNGDIVELSSSGEIQKVNMREFMNTGVIGTAMSVYVSSRDGRAIGNEKVAERALSKVRTHRKYNFILDNCHQFCSGCLTGDFENSDNFLWMLKNTVLQHIAADEWRVWNN